MGLPKEKHHLHIELTAEQYQLLCQQAKLCGLCKRAYIVRLIDGTPIRARPSQEIKALRTEIHHIGNTRQSRAGNKGGMRMCSAKQALYQDWKDGEITRNDYRHMSEDYERQAEALNKVLRTLTDEQEQLENGVDAESPFLAAFLKYQNIDKLTREILAELIDHIKVYEGGNISVKFKYADEFRRLAEYIELNTPMVQGVAG